MPAKIESVKATQPQKIGNAAATPPKGIKGVQNVPPYNTKSHQPLYSKEILTQKVGENWKEFNN